MGGSSSRINESKTNHAASVPESSSKKLYNSIVRIEVDLNEKEKVAGTGFLIKFNLKDKERYFLMTCQHVIKEEFVKSKKVIKFYYGEADNEKELKIGLGERYIKYFDEPLDVTLIEILKKDNINEDKFLQPDFSYKNGYNFYADKKNDFYLAGYPNNKERSISSGKITKILKEKVEFEHDLDAEGGNSGSPICLANSLFVVGIHKQGHKTEPINYGTFLGYILNILEKEENLEYKKEEFDIKILNKTKNQKEKGKEGRSKKSEK